ncbi:ArsR/SmtB family transcription factor [Rummeliibacillus pycnus]|uniref:ArsR/SmtB family transcription factor n=1 Tax=Rummeliibacillus pycnus TaxID=101070 RepID=UPI000C99A7A6|nr:helix-turn-helix domain-containing protein [Rummeliibacillus pycnus]
MEPLLIFKALSNEKRLMILEWLKNPEQHFVQQKHLSESDHFEGGVCVGSICDKAELVQSVTSSYLNMMQNAGLLESKRIGKWTYYRRNEKVIKQLSEYIHKEL